MFTASAWLAFTSPKQKVTSFNSIYFDTATCPPLTLTNGIVTYNTAQLHDLRLWLSSDAFFSCNIGYRFGVRYFSNVMFVWKLLIS